MGRRRQFWIGSDRIERKHYGAWAEEERWTSSPASYSLMEAGALLRVKIAVCSLVTMLQSVPITLAPETVPTVRRAVCS